MVSVLQGGVLAMRVFSDSSGPVQAVPSVFLSLQNGSSDGGLGQKNTGTISRTIVYYRA